MLDNDGRSSVGLIDCISYYTDVKRDYGPPLSVQEWEGSRFEGRMIVILQCIVKLVYVGDIYS